MEIKVKSEVLIEVIDKLVGDYRAYGETNHDNESNENLRVLCDVVAYYVDKIYFIVKNKNRVETSLRKSGLIAEDFFKVVSEYIDYLDNE